MRLEHEVAGARPRAQGARKGSTRRVPLGSTFQIGHSEGHGWHLKGGDVEGLVTLRSGPRRVRLSLEERLSQTVVMEMEAMAPWRRRGGGLKSVQFQVCGGHPS